MVGENYKNGGRENKVTIFINKKYTKLYEGKEYSLNNRLKICHNCFCSIKGCDIIEKINDSRPRYPSSSEIGVFNLCGTQGSNPIFSLTFGQFEISSSPFINVQGNNIKGRICLNYSYFTKSQFTNDSEVIIIVTNNGWNGKGSMAEVLKTLSHTSQGCKFLLEKKSIVYID